MANSPLPESGAIPEVDDLNSVLESIKLFDSNSMLAGVPVHLPSRRWDVYVLAFLSEPRTLTFVHYAGVPAVSQNAYSDQSLAVVFGDPGASPIPLVFRQVNWSKVNLSFSISQSITQKSTQSASFTYRNVFLKPYHSATKLVLALFCGPDTTTPWSRYADIPKYITQVKNTFSVSPFSNGVVKQYGTGMLYGYNGSPIIDLPLYHNILIKAVRAYDTPIYWAETILTQVMPELKLIDWKDENFEQQVLTHEVEGWCAHLLNVPAVLWGDLELKYQKCIGKFLVQALYAFRKRLHLRRYHPLPDWVAYIDDNKMWFGKDGLVQIPNLLAEGTTEEIPIHMMNSGLDKSFTRSGILIQRDFRNMQLEEPDELFKQADLPTNTDDVLQAANMTFMGTGDVIHEGYAPPRSAAASDVLWGYDTQMNKPRMLHQGTIDSSMNGGAIVHHDSVYRMWADLIKNGTCTGSTSDFLFHRWRHAVIAVQFSSTPYQIGSCGLSYMFARRAQANELTISKPDLNFFSTLPGVQSHYNDQKTLVIKVPFFQPQTRLVHPEKDPPGSGQNFLIHPWWLYVRAQLRIPSSGSNSVPYTIWYWFEGYEVDTRQPGRRNDPSDFVLQGSSSSAQESTSVNIYVGDSGAQGGTTGGSSSASTSIDPSLTASMQDGQNCHIPAFPIFQTQDLCFLKANKPNLVNQFSLGFAQTNTTRNRFPAKDEFTWEHFAGWKSFVGLTTIDTSQQAGTTIWSQTINFQDPVGNQVSFQPLNCTAFARADYVLTFEMLAGFLHQCRVMCEVVYGDNDVALFEPTQTTWNLGGTSTHAVRINFRAVTDWLRSHDLEVFPNGNGLELTTKLRIYDYVTVRLIVINPLLNTPNFPTTVSILIYLHLDNLAVAVPARPRYTTKPWTFFDQFSDELNYTVPLNPQLEATPERTDAFVMQMQPVAPVAPGPVIVPTVGSTMEADHSSSSTSGTGPSQTAEGGLLPPPTRPGLGYEGSDVSGGTVSKDANTPAVEEMVTGIDTGIQKKISYPSSCQWFGDSPATLQSIVKREIQYCQFLRTWYPNPYGPISMMIIPVSPRRWPTNTLMNMACNSFMGWKGSLNYSFKVSCDDPSYTGFKVIYHPGALYRDRSSSFCVGNKSQSSPGGFMYSPDPTEGGVTIFDRLVNGMIRVNVPYYSEFEFLTTFPSATNVGEVNGILELQYDPVYPVTDGGIAITTNVSVFASAGDDFQLFGWNGMRGWDVMDGDPRAGLYLPVKTMNREVMTPIPITEISTGVTETTTITTAMSKAVLAPAVTGAIPKRRLFVQKDFRSMSVGDIDEAFEKQMYTVGAGLAGLAAGVAVSKVSAMGSAVNKTLTTATSAATRVEQLATTSEELVATIKTKLDIQVPNLTRLVEAEGFLPMLVSTSVDVGGVLHHHSMFSVFQLVANTICKVYPHLINKLSEITSRLGEIVGASNEEGDGAFEKQAMTGDVGSRLSRVFDFIKWITGVPFGTAKQFIAWISNAGRFGYAVAGIERGWKSAKGFYVWIWECFLAVLHFFHLYEPSNKALWYLIHNKEQATQILDRASYISSKEATFRLKWDRNLRMELMTCYNFFKDIDLNDPRMSSGLIARLKPIKTRLAVAVGVVQDIPLPVSRKIDPFVVYVYGLPGIGKSCSLAPMLMRLMKMTGRLPPKDVEPFYAINGVDPYLSSQFDPRAEGFIVDDFGQLNKTEDTSIEFLMAIKTNNPYHPVYPELERKGAQWHPSIGVLGSNNHTATTNIVHSMEALTRRRNLCWHCCLTKEFTKDGKLDMEKMDALSAQDRGLFPQLKFQRMKVLAETVYEGWEDKWVDYATFIQINYWYAKNHLEKQTEDVENYMKDIKEYYTEGENEKFKPDPGVRDLYYKQMKEGDDDILADVDDLAIPEEPRTPIVSADCTAELEASNSVTADAMNTAYEWKDFMNVKDPFWRPIRHMRLKRYIRKTTVEMSNSLAGVLEPYFKKYLNDGLGCKFIYQKLDYIETRHPFTGPVRELCSLVDYNDWETSHKNLIDAGVECNHWGMFHFVFCVIASVEPRTILMGKVNTCGSELVVEGITDEHICTVAELFPMFNWSQELAKVWIVRATIYFSHLNLIFIGSDATAFQDISLLDEAREKYGSIVTWLSHHKKFVLIGALTGLLGAAAVLLSMKDEFQTQTGATSSGDGRTRFSPRVTHAVPFVKQGGFEVSANILNRHLYQLIVGAGSVYAIGIGGHMLLTVKHAATVSKTYKTFDVIRHGQRYTVQTSECLWSDCEGLDATILTLPSHTPAVAHNAHFAPEGVVSQLFSGEGFVLFHKDFVNYSFNVQFQWRENKIPIKDADDIHPNGYLSNYYIYPCESFEGLCGAPLVYASKEATYIVGMHCAGRPNKCGVAQPITREFIEGLKDVSGKLLLTVDPIDVDIECCAQTFELQAAEDFRGSKYVGRVRPGVRCPEKTTLRKSVIHGVLQSAVTAPAALSPRDVRVPQGYSLMRVGMSKFDGKPPPFNMDILNRVRDHYRTEYFSLLPTRKMNDILTVEESVCPPPLPDYERVNPHSSEGYPLVIDRPCGFHSSAWMFESTDESLKLKYDRHKDLVHQHCEASQNGVHYSALFVASLKDERRPLAKVLKPRLFLASSKIFTLHHRRHLLDFIVTLQRNKFSLGHAVGTNVHGMDWKHWFDYLGEVGHNWIAGDHKNFDGKISPRVMAMIFDAARDWGYQYGVPRDHHFCYEGLKRDHLYPHVLVFDHVFQLPKGEPSGSPSTASFNTEYNRWLMAIIWLELAGQFSWEHYSLDSFSRCTRVLAYGDDIIISVDKSATTWFNMKTIQQQLLTKGLEFTDPSKCEVTREFISPSEATFLKRYFRPVGKIVYAPMSLDALFEIPNWIRTSKFCTDGEQTRINVECVIRECVHLGRRAFGKIRAILNRALRDNNIEIVNLNYDDIHLQNWPEVTPPSEEEYDFLSQEDYDKLEQRTYDYAL